MFNAESFGEHRILGALPRGVGLRLLGAVKPRSLRAGETLELRMDKPAHIWFVLDGLLESLVLSPSGNPVTLDILAPGDSFGCLSLSLGECLSEIRAVRPSRLAGLPADAFPALLARYPRLADAVRLEVALRVRRLALLRSILAERAQRRVAGILMVMCEKIGPRLPLTRQTLASMAGLAPESVSRALQSLSRAGLIQSRHREILIPRPEALSELIGSGSKR